MKTWSPLILPFLLFIGLVIIFATCPDVTGWAVSESFEYLSYVLLGIGMLLGAVFAQSRISFICIFISFITCVVDYSFFIKGDVARGSAVVLLSSIYVPSLAALFYRLSERGLLTSHAGFRALLLLSAMMVIFLLPMVPELASSILHAKAAMFRPLSDYIRIPLVGILSLLVSLPFLIIRKQHESPFLGRLIGVAMLFVFGALNQPVTGSAHGRLGEAMLLTFMSGSGITLIWAVLESSWRSANIDELTELPGRRVLKHHLASLGPSYAIAMLDIDHFKKINDKYGHDTGDQVLRFLAAQLGRNLAGKAYRYGGEEFVIVCERENFDQTAEALELLRRTISGRKFWIRSKTRPKKKPEDVSSYSKGKEGHGHGESITVTVSIGVAKNTGKHSATPQEVLEAADKALYRAKKEGRDRMRTAA